MNPMMVELVVKAKIAERLSEVNAVHSSFFKRSSSLMWQKVAWHFGDRMIHFGNWLKNFGRLMNVEDVPNECGSA
jgi:hypothetical protein